ncbi:uncharacterized protein BDZ99DRAFT_524112 [Mytilinidion resinicola]|uniref:Uncharacterized protein n=1 Tax=Mytilinidion resinicola TaxID=574789 RepID=A0A6A6YBB5_9PEZI|nr:uncharacterized protein BDZ99DRAFT_524112 [Mytilinidion resinicola]KAF2805868.1 hypothetical protein BDZ99DRAFT_524112 [Mytilinidion resinicola]
MSARFTILPIRARRNCSSLLPLLTFGTTANHITSATIVEIRNDRESLPVFQVAMLNNQEKGVDAHATTSIQPLVQSQNSPSRGYHESNIDDVATSKFKHPLLLTLLSVRLNAVPNKSRGPDQILRTPIRLLKLACSASSPHPTA